MKYLFDRNPSMFHTFDADQHQHQVLSTLQSVDLKDDTMIENSELTTENLEKVGLIPAVSKVSEVDMTSGSMNTETALLPMCVEAELLPASPAFGKTSMVRQEESKESMSSAIVHDSLMPLFLCRPNHFEGLRILLLFQLKEDKLLNYPKNAKR
jgi:hypothetical protein